MTLSGTPRQGEVRALKRIRQVHHSKQSAMYCSNSAMRSNLRSEFDHPLQSLDQFVGNPKPD
jgi:hypothetical protein